MQEKEFGIYILSWPGDYHLAVPLIRSIRHYHPDVPIMVIPGEAFDRNDHPFDVEILADPPGFWGEMSHQSKDFWTFQGPFKKFLYLDGDMLCTGPLDTVIQRILAENGRYLFVHVCFSDAEEWKAAIADPKHPEHEECKAWVRRALGNPEKLRDFDPQYDPYGRAPFNSGIFGGQVGTITEEQCRDLFEREQAYFETVLKRPFTWKSWDLFYGDQGRLNYLVSKANLPVHDLYPDGHDFWAGDIVEKATVEKWQKGELGYKFIHWAGVKRPTPSLFFEPPLQRLGLFANPCPVYERYEGYPEVPGYELWRQFQVPGQFPMRVRDRAKATWLDMRRVVEQVKQRSKRALGRKKPVG